MTARRNRRVGIQNEIKPLEPLLWSVALKQLIRIVLLAAQRQFFFGASAVWQPDCQWPPELIQFWPIKLTQ